MKFVLISPKNRTVYNFRGDLIKDIIEKGYEVVVIGPDMTDVEKIEALGARFIEIPMNKTGTSITADLRYFNRMYSIIKREKPDITLGYTVKPCTYGAMAARLAGVKNVNSMITGGGYTFTARTMKARALGIIVRVLYRFGLMASHHIIFQNRDDLNEFCTKGIANRKKCAMVNGSGVNIEYFSPVGLPATPSFFMLSRLLKSKGVREYLQAARALKKRHPEVRFYLLGKYEEDMQDAIDPEWIETYIKDGTVERFDETNDVRPYYAMCSAYVLPSYREGTPRTVLEAMAMGRAIITTDTNGCRETVKNGVNGYLVPVGSSRDVARQMNEMVENPELFAEMGRESRQYVEEKYAVDKVNADMLRIMGISRQFE